MHNWVEKLKKYFNCFGYNIYVMPSKELFLYIIEVLWACIDYILCFLYKMHELLNVHTNATNSLHPSNISNK